MDGRVLLLEELTSRKNRNASYSLRAFARDLGVSPASLSQYLLRRRELSKRNRQLITERLKLSPLEQKVFLETKPGRVEVETHELLSEDTFKFISDWVSIATMNLARLSDNQATPAWIATRLGIEEADASEVLERLLRMGFIQAENGKMVRTGKSFATTTDVPSAALKRFHLSLLQKAQQALLEIPVEDRDITAIVMPTDKKKLAEAKQILKRARRRIADLVSTSEAEEVYVLAVQLFPLSGTTEKKV